MSQIQIEITDAHDQKRFDYVLARTVEMMSNAKAQDDVMITVRTEGYFDHLIKVVSCKLPDALIFFSESYYETSYYA